VSFEERVKAGRITRYQWLVLTIAWLGWVFDSMDATIYALVLQPSLSELLQHAHPSRAVSPEEIGWYGGLIFSIFLVGWALGGVLFGIMADAFGRTKTLMLTILIYALFTGLAALSQTWWELGLYRFFTALGIGGEWAAGATIVAEVWPEESRTKAAGWLQSAWAVGFFLAAAIQLALRETGWRNVFLVGILPAFVALLVRLAVKEPDRWIKARDHERATRTHRHLRFTELFRVPLRRRTLVGTGLAFVAVCGLWGATNWAPTLIRLLPDLRDLDVSAINSRVSYAIMALNAGAFVGYLTVGPMAERWGRRGTFALMFAGSLVLTPMVFLGARNYQDVLLLLPLVGFFTNGVFSGFPIYLPELYPTRLRATGAGFCFNAGRLIAAGGPFATGALVMLLGSIGGAASTVASIYLVGLLLLLAAPETRGRPLPD
jgi:MFS family permease